jgi:hypothetical protein
VIRPFLLTRLFPADSFRATASILRFDRYM